MPSRDCQRPASERASAMGKQGTPISSPKPPNRKTAPPSPSLKFKKNCHSWGKKKKACHPGRLFLLWRGETRGAQPARRTRPEPGSHTSKQQRQTMGDGLQAIYSKTKFLDNFHFRINHLSVIRAVDKGTTLSPTAAESNTYLSNTHPWRSKKSSVSPDHRLLIRWCWPRGWRGQPRSLAGPASP